MRASPPGFRPSAILLRIYAALLAALGLTVGLSMTPPGILRIVSHYAIAFLMAALIVAIFMGLRSAGTLIRWFALGGLMWLLFLLALAPVDYLTR